MFYRFATHFLPFIAAIIPLLLVLRVGYEKYLRTEILLFLHVFLCPSSDGSHWLAPSLLWDLVQFKNENTKYHKEFFKCRNPSLGLATKARAYEGTSQEGSPGVTFHAPESARECEGMNLHTPKWAPTLRIGVPVDSQIFIEQLQGSKPIKLKSSLYHWKALRT